MFAVYPVYPWSDASNIFKSHLDAFIFLSCPLLNFFLSYTNLPVQRRLTNHSKT